MYSTNRRTALLLFTFILSASASTAEARDAAISSEAAPDVAIPSVWATLDEHWNGRDSQSFSDVFTANASLQFVDAGVTLEGSEAILQHFSKQFPTFPPEIRHETSVDKVRRVASDVNVVDATVRILRHTTGNEEDMTLLRTFSVFAVMLDTAEGWRIHMLRAYLLRSKPEPD